MSKDKNGKRNGIFKTLGVVLKGDPKKEYSVRKLAAKLSEKHKVDTKKATKCILQVAAWCKRNDVKCAKLIHDHKPKPAAKTETKAKGKKAEKDPLA